MFDSFPMPDAKLYILDTPEAVAREAAVRFVAAAGRAVEASAPLRVALAGGTTPLAAYRLLSGDAALRHSVHWESVEFFWGDERFVPADHADSNYRAARETLLDPLGIDPSRVHRIPTDAASPEDAAASYEALLDRTFRTSAPRAPRFDLVLLGLGSDGHTASLFPGALPAAGDRPLVAATRRPEDGSARVTLTPAALNAAASVLFLVTGGAKSEALERTMRAERPDPAIPASLIRPVAGKITWLADRAAAARIVEQSGGTQGGNGR